MTPVASEGSTGVDPSTANPEIKGSILATILHQDEKGRGNEYFFCSQTKIAIKMHWKSLM
jgi:hypothetical protein